MVLLTAENIKKSFTEKTLLENINLTINSEDKIGLIGVNGSGKSTLLKIIAGVMESEGGSIICARDLRMVYLPQNPPYEENLSVIDQALKYCQGMDLPRYRCETMLTKLGLSNFEQKMGELSGGQRKRVALAATLSAESNLIILDEPTNHMDNDVIRWLEDFLISYKGAVFMITHDRYFLDRITNCIVEIDKGILYRYEGNYDYYVETKAQRKEMELAGERKRATIYRKELAWIRRGAQARSTKAKGRIQRFKELEDSKLEIDEESLNLRTLSSRLGKKIIEVNNISKSYGDLKLIEGFTYTLLRNDRVGIVGPNGCGKSTLLGIIMGKVTADAGFVSKGETVKIGYFSQENTPLDESLRVIKLVSGIAENIRTEEGTFSASQMLERFLFPPSMHSMEVGRLSGGEKRRLYLLCILMGAPNVLVLDEPTNDLDIETLTILEDYLDDFSGAVITVSHDRYFLDRVCTKIFAFRGQGEIRQYMGGYSDYEEKFDEEEKTKVKKAKEEKKKAGDGRNQRKKLKFTYMEKKEFETIEEDISAIEEEIQSVNDEMAKNPSDSGKLAALAAKAEELEEKLLEKMERWEYLTELNEKIEGQKE